MYVFIYLEPGFYHIAQGGFKLVITEVYLGAKPEMPF